MAAHKLLIENGIPLDHVLYICYGIELGSGVDGWGAIDNFTIFTAAKFDEYIQQNTGKDLDRSNNNDLNGFCTGMLDGN